jgi:hypothetical protein
MFKWFRNLTSMFAVFLIILLPACQQSPVPADEAATELSGNWRETELILPGYDKPQKVIYEIVGDEAIFEGDIILGKVDAQGNLIKSDLSSQGIVRDGGRWPGGMIPFVINSNVTDSGRTHIMEAIDHWEEKTPINFVTKTASHSNYVEFVRGDSAGACSSYVGRKGGKQEIKLTSSGDCSRGALIHEIGHAVGLYHEQSREDRDSHVTIMWDNIEDGREHNFNKRVSGATDIDAYDYGSIMHYGAFSFCKRNSSGSCVGPTIVTIPAGIAIGQRNGLSRGDIYTVLTIYPIVKHPRVVEDVTGDGKKDIVAFGNDGVYVSISTGSGFTAPSRWLANYSHNNGLWRTEKHVRLLGDVNADGKADIVGFGDRGVFVSLSTGSSFSAARFLIAELGYNQSWRTEKHLRFLADINGDGKQDIVGFGDAGVWAALSTSTTTAPSFTPASFVRADYGYNAGGWRTEKNPRMLADVNGDKKLDIVGFANDGVYVSLSTSTATVPGFTVPSRWIADFTLDTFGWQVDKHPRFLANADSDLQGKQDIFGFGDDGVWGSLSTGARFTPAGFWVADFGFNQGWRVEKHPRLLGLVDDHPNSDIVGFGDAGVYVSLSQGGPVSFVIPDFGYETGWRVDKNPRFLARINADGRDDIVGFGDDGVWLSLSTGSGFTRASFVLARYGYNDGWR